MPVVGIPLHYLKRFIGDAIDAEELIDIFHEIGVSVDGIEKVWRFSCGRCGEINEPPSQDAPLLCDNCRGEFAKEGVDFKRLDPVDMFKLELLSNRPDNFDAAGIARSLKGYTGIETGPVTYSVNQSAYEVTVDPRLSQPASCRPCIACATVTGVSLDDDDIKSIMKLQENLHWALGRNRKFAAIGLYDLSTIGTKVRYRAVADDEIAFVPLACGGYSTDEAFSPKRILAEHPKGKAFARLLDGYERFPLLIDDRDTVLSMPPIINSEKTRVTKATRGFFIDVTGYNMKTIETALNIIVTSLKDSLPACEINAVTVRYPGNKAVVTPRLAPETFMLDYGRCAAIVGCELSAGRIVECLKRMRYDAHDLGGRCRVTVPCYRADIRHEQDLIEDVAIAYGYKNIVPRKLEAFTTGSILPAERKKQEVREALVSMGFLEIVSIMLTSEAREFERLGLPVPSDRVIIDNPISADQTMVRMGLTSGLLEIIAANTSNELPQRLFETGEVARVATDGGVIEEVALAVGIVDSKAGFSDIRSVLKNLMHETGVSCTLEANDSPLYLAGRSGSVVLNGRRVGHLGEVHPRILDDMKIPNPAVVLELNLSAMGIIGG